MEDQNTLPFERLHALDYLQGMKVVLQNPDGSLGTQLSDSARVWNVENTIQGPRLNISVDLPIKIYLKYNDWCSHFVDRCKGKLHIFLPQPENDCLFYTR